MFDGLAKRWRKLLVCIPVVAAMACHSEYGPNKKPQVLAHPADEVAIAADSPKRGYIKLATAQLQPRPLPEPVAGKIVYDETRTARVASRIAGRVVSALPPLGEKVAAGLPLLELDSPELGAAQSAYANALADLKLAENAHRRIKTLVDSGVSPHKDLIQAEDELAKARSEADRAKARLANLGMQDLKTDNRFFLHSPIAGTLTERNVNPGMEVRPDAPNSLFVVSDLSHLWMQMQVFEKDLSVVHVGQKVQLEVPAYPGAKFPATVEYIGQVVDDTTRTVNVRCAVPNPAGKLLPAMYATADLQSGAGDSAIVVPLSALFTEGESDWVFVEIGDGRFRKLPVRAGFRLKDRAVIEEGLKAGERLVVDGALLLRSEEASKQDDDEAK